jgi:hypothetical protein
MSNPYITQICQQTGATEREVVRDMMPALRPMTFPCEIHGRHFESHDDYMNELHEFIAGM